MNKLRSTTPQDDERMRVLWMVPEFPVNDDDHRYVFLKNEARHLLATAKVDLTIIAETGGPYSFQDLCVKPLSRPATPFQRLRMVVWNLVADPRLVLRAAFNPAKHLPLMWRQHAFFTEARELQPHIINSFFAAPLGTGSVAIAHRLGIPCIASLRGVDLALVPSLGYGYRLDPEYQRRFDRMLDRADIITVHSRAFREIALDAGAPEERCVLVPNPVESPDQSDLDVVWARQFVQKFGIPPSARIVLSIGRVIPLKGFDRGVESIGALSSNIRDSVHYVIIGGEDPREPNVKSQLMGLAEHLGVEHQVHLVGPMRQSDVWSLLHIADAYMFTSRFEGFGNVVTEAFSAGLPIVASPQGIARDVLEDDRFSKIVESENPRDWAEALHSVLTESESREALLAARSESLARFAPESRSATLLALYQSAIEGGNPVTPFTQGPIG